MILRELFYMNNDQKEMSQDDRYDADRDDSVVKKKDTRKQQLRLSLKQINRLRRAGDLHEIESAKDIEFVGQMYAQPAPEQ